MSPLSLDSPFLTRTPTKEAAPLLSRRALLAISFGGLITQSVASAERELDTGFKLVTCSAWSPDGRKLACASAEGELAWWEWPSRRKLGVLNGHSKRITSLSWNVDSKRLASAGWDSEILIWDTTMNQISRKMLAPGGVAAWSPDGKRMAVSYGNSGLALFDDLAGSPTRVLLGWSAAVSWSPDGSRLASASGSRVTLWDARSGLASKLLVPTARLLTPPVWCRRGTALVVPAANNSVEVVEVTAGAIVRKLKNTPVASIAGTGDGIRAALWEREGKVRVWNLTDGQIEGEFEAPRSGTDSLAWHPEGRLIALCSLNGRVRFAENRTGEL